MTQDLWLFNTETLRLMEKDALAVAECKANTKEAIDTATSCALLIAVERYARGDC